MLHMTPFKQLNRHRPEQGVIGDCWRTAIGCLLNMPPQHVPHFADGEWDKPLEVNAKTRAWLAQLGFGFVEVAYSGTLESVLTSVGAMNPGTYYLLGGNSRTGCGHSVIACDNEIVWDPSINDSGIVGPMDDDYYWIAFLVPLCIVKQPERFHAVA